MSRLQYNGEDTVRWTAPDHDRTGWKACSLERRSLYMRLPSATATGVVAADDVRRCLANHRCIRGQPNPQRGSVKRSERISLPGHLRACTLFLPNSCAHRIGAEQIPI
jgi:hypothetical protein